MWTASDIGQSMVLLALVFLGAALIRKWSRHLRALFLPTAVIGGFLALALGPEGVGRIAHSNGIFPEALATEEESCRWKQVLSGPVMPPGFEFTISNLSSATK